VDVKLKVNPRARRISLRLDPARGEVVVTAPSARRLAEAAAFAQSRRAWIAERLAALPDRTPLEPDQTLMVDGAPCRLERAAMRITPRLQPAEGGEPARLIAYGEGEAYQRAVVRALKAIALSRLTERTADYARRLAHPLPRLAVMDAKMRWGSCRQAVGPTPAQIRYNWRLILAPPFVLDYVAAHEAAHLIEANHSAAYWVVVEGLYGDPRSARQWLRVEGARLHAVGF
jgi:predicted metal-dependent hydrolase